MENNAIWIKISNIPEKAFLGLASLLLLRADLALIVPSSPRTDGERQSDSPRPVRERRGLINRVFFCSQMEIIEVQILSDLSAECVAGNQGGKRIKICHFHSRWTKNSSSHIRVWFSGSSYAWGGSAFKQIAGKERLRQATVRGREIKKMRQVSTSGHAKWNSVEEDTHIP